MRYLFIIISCCSLVNAQYTQIPDPAFEQWLINNVGDSEGMLDGQILTSDIEDVTAIEINMASGISDFTGLQDFTALVSFEAALTLCTTIDFSGNINLEILFLILNDDLDSVNLDNCVALESLTLDRNLLTSLDVSDCQNIRFVRASFNMITDVDVSTNVTLESLVLGENAIESIDLSNNPILNRLSVSANNLDFLDVRNGANEILDFEAENNPDLRCVFVDDVGYATANWSSDIDATATFVSTQQECDAVLSIAQLELEDIALFPNPVTSYVKVTGAPSSTQGILYDARGKRLLFLKSLDAPLDMRSLPAGLYFMELFRDRQRVVKRVVKR